jgi:Na+/melibiose symporter-like transporter
VVAAVTPLVAGNFIATARVKKKISLGFNGTARTSMLLIPLMLMAGLPNNVVIAVFFCIITVFYICQSVTGIAWNYLLGTCVQPEQRGKLLGTLFAVSGLISFMSSNIVRVLRESETLLTNQRYSAIFGLGGFIMASSVLFFIPLKEAIPREPAKNERNLKFYIASLLHCCKNKLFLRLIITQVFSQICTTINTFVFVFANERLELATQWISLMIIIQTVGVVWGGLVTGRISARFGSKRTLMLAEGIGIVIPLLQLTALLAKPAGAPSPLGPGFMLATTFLMGFNRSGFMAFQSHLLEIAGNENSVYYVVAKSVLLLPVSFVSMLVGRYFDRFPDFVQPVYIVQILAAATALFFASRLRLFLYPKDRAEQKA